MALLKYRYLISISILFCSSICAAREDTWIEVKSPHFTIISDASSKEAKKTAKILEQFRLVIRSFPNLRIDPGSPLTVFAARDAKSYRTITGEERQEKGAKKTAGLFLAGPEKDLVVISMEGDQKYQAIYHEYVHMLARVNLGEIPLWLHEGIAQFYEQARVEDGATELGYFSPGALYILNTKEMVPLPTLFSIEHDSPYYTQEEMAQIFYAQSWALTHYLMMMDESNPLPQFLNSLKKGVDQEKAANMAFGDLEVLEEELRKYVRNAAFYKYRVTTKLDVDESLYLTRALSPAELLGLRGELLLYADKPDKARQILEQALQLDARSPRANEVMGHLYLRQKNREQAGKFFTIAAELDSKSYLAQYYAAETELQKEDSADLAVAERYLRKVIEINPRFAAAYHQLAYIFRRDESKLSEAFAMAQKAVLLEPAELSHQLIAASLLAEMDKVDDAEAMGQQILSRSRTAAERLAAVNFLDTIKSYKEAQVQAKRFAEEMVEDQSRHEEERKRQLEEIAEQQRLAEEKPSRKPEVRKPVKTGSAVKVRGIIKAVQCEYPAIMTVILDAAGGKQQLLQTENFLEVKYWSDSPAGKNEFNPCKELKGKQVEIEYLTVTGQEFSGVITTVSIEN